MTAASRIRRVERAECGASEIVRDAHGAVVVRRCTEAPHADPYHADRGRAFMRWEDWEAQTGQARPKLCIPPLQLVGSSEA